MLGTGHWADTVHAAGLAAHPDVDLVAVWGRDPVKAEAVAQRHGAVAEPDLDAVLDMVDAVAIAVPPDVQAELACRAAERGCHLLLEKPLALSVAGADRVVEAADRAGVQSVVFFVRRFAEPSATWFDEVVAPGSGMAGAFPGSPRSSAAATRSDNHRGGSSTAPCGISALMRWPRCCPRSAPSRTW